MWDKIRNELSSPSFWVSVITAGFIINILAAYAKEGIDSVFPPRFAKWKERRSESRRQRIYALSRSNQLQRLRSLETLLAAVACVAFTITSCTTFLGGAILGFQPLILLALSIVSTSFLAHALFAASTGRRELREGYELRLLSTRIDLLPTYPKKLDALEAAAKTLVALDPQQQHPTEALLAFMDSAIDLQKDTVKSAWALSPDLQIRIQELDLLLLASMHILVDHHRAARTMTGEASKARWLAWQQSAFSISSKITELVTVIKSDLQALVKN